MGVEDLSQTSLENLSLWELRFTIRDSKFVSK
jgi:hypothetical protein